MPDVELAKIVGWPDPPPPVEWRWIEYPSRALTPGETPICRGWARPRRPLPDDPRLHEAALAYLSDWASQGAIERRFTPAFAHERFASLDHAVWVHEPARWDDWLACHRPQRHRRRRPCAHAARGLHERRSTDRHHRAGGADGRARRGRPAGAVSPAPPRRALNPARSRCPRSADRRSAGAGTAAATRRESGAARRRCSASCPLRTPSARRGAPGDRPPGRRATRAG